MLSSRSSNRSAEEFLILACVKDPTSLSIIAVFAALNLLLFPLYLLVLFVGFKQWRQRQQQGALSGMGTSDVLTYNLALVEIIGNVSAGGFAGSSWNNLTPGLIMSFCLFVMYFFGEAMFHCGICVDRYLAVVHPIAYRNLKEARAVLIRNVTVVFCWLCIALWCVYVPILYPDFPAKELLAVIIFFTLVVFYCCLCALYFLTRPGPDNKKQVDQSKLRAFHIISTITCLLFVKMIGVLVYLCFYILAPLKPSLVCRTLISSVIVITPVNTLIPLLFLRRMKQTFR